MSLNAQEKADLLVNQMAAVVFKNVSEHFKPGSGKLTSGIIMPEQPLTREEVAKAIAIGIANAAPHLMMLISIADLEGIKKSTLESIATYEAKMVAPE